MIYQATFIDHGDRSFGTASFEAQDDRDAIERARSLFRTGIGKGYRITHSDRTVHIEIFRE
jgi:hypothetical protein